MVYLLPFYRLEQGDYGYGDIGVHKDGKEEQKADFSSCGGVDFIPFANEGNKSHQKHHRIGESDISEQAFDNGRGITPTENAEEQGCDAGKQQDYGENEGGHYIHSHIEKRKFTVFKNCFYKLLAVLFPHLEEAF